MRHQRTKGICSWDGPNGVIREDATKYNYLFWGLCHVPMVYSLPFQTCTSSQGSFCTMKVTCTYSLPWDQGTEYDFPAWYPCFYLVPSLGLSSATSRTLWKWWCITSSAGSSRHCGSCLGLSRMAPVGKPLPCHEHMWAVLHRVLHEESWGLPRRARATLAAMWLNHLGSRSSHPSQAFRWRQPGLTSDRDLLTEPRPGPVSQATPEFLIHRYYKR